MCIRDRSCTEAAVPGAPVVVFRIEIVSAIPVAPVAPVEPVGPAGPVTPVGPAGPCSPVFPETTQIGRQHGLR